MDASPNDELRRGPGPGTARRTWGRAALVAGAVAVVALVAFAVFVFLGGPQLIFQAQFELSRHPLTSVVQRVQSGEIVHTPVAIGQFRVTRISKVDTSIRFVISDSTELDHPIGLVFQPGKQPSASDSWSFFREAPNEPSGGNTPYYTPLGGGWWYWSEGQ